MSTWRSSSSGVILSSFPLSDWIKERWDLAQQVRSASLYILNARNVPSSSTAPSAHSAGTNIQILKRDSRNLWAAWCLKTFWLRPLNSAWFCFYLPGFPRRKLFRLLWQISCDQSCNWSLWNVLARLKRGVSWQWWKHEERVSHWGHTVKLTN